MLPDYLVQKPKRSGKKIFSLILLLIILLVGGFGIYAYAKINQPVNSVDTDVQFSVPKGASTKQVGNRLSDVNLIASPNVFVVYSKLIGASGKIQAGDYILNRKMNMKEILDTLTSGKVTRNTKRVTIVEGRTAAQIGQQLDDQGLATKEQFASALDQIYDFEFASTAKEFDFQGYLFPDTYEFSANWSAIDMVNAMLKNFEIKFTPQMVTDLEKKNMSMHDLITLASIVEREVGRTSSITLTEEVRTKMQEERQNVASVFLNRLEIDMALQSDATVNFATGKSDRRALIEDTKINSPYNTYQVKGLPPGPISNPGIDAIKAVLYPADTNYLYFLNNQEGVAYFATTLDEHNSNRVKYLD